MTLLELVIIAHRCRSTHHFIAIDALSLLRGEHAPLWHDLILRHHDSLLKGAKAPDTTFKDFKNHVLHVEEGEWGGARDAAMEWYGKAVAALRRQNWSDAAYALGVMTHYYADPIQPFHTAQSEEEGVIHRALEWSIAKSRDTIKAMIDARGYPIVHAGRQTGFVADMVLDGARYSNPHYQTFIDHYDIHKGVQDPEAGLDQTLLDVLADLIAYATAGVATLFERAFEESAVKPPKTDLDLPGYFAALDIPIRKITRRISDRNDRRKVEAMYEEFVATGKVIKILPADDKAIRKLHAEQVLRKPLAELDAQPLKPLGSKHVAIDKPAKPVEYVLKLVPVPAGSREAFTPEPLSPLPVGELRPESTPPNPDPDVFDVEEQAAPAEVDTKTVEAEPDVESPAEPEIEAAKAEAEAEPSPEIAEEDVATELETSAEMDATEEIEADVTEEDVAAAADDDEDDSDNAEIEPEEVSASADDDDDSEPDSEIKTDADEEEAPTPAARVLAEIEAHEKDKAEAEAKAKDEADASNKTKPKSKAERTDRLTEDSHVVDAPSIGPKTADRLANVGIHTIGDLLAADVAETAAALNVRYITVETLTDWQDQTRLMLEAPGLRVLDSQILVGAGIRSARDLANASARSVLKAATSFLETPSGSRVLWGAESKVDEGEVRQWIDLAKSGLG